MLYALAALIASLAGIFVMQLWNMSFGVPFFYNNRGDELLMVSWTKALIDDGWYATISHLGAPFGMSFADFPVPSLLHMIVLKIITLFIHNAPAALNLYFVAAFPLTAIVAAYVLRRLGMSWATTIPIAVVYSVLPTRFLRNEAHFFYAQYYLVPILVLAVIWVFRDHPLFDSSTRRPNRDGYIFLFGMLAIAWDNEYNAVFAMLLLALAAAASFARTRAWRGTIAAAAGIAVIFIGVEFELLPTIINRVQHGPNRAAVVRLPEESEMYALTFAQLVLPIQGHRIGALARKRAFYDSRFPPLVNENSTASLGLLVALGFVGSLGALLLFRSEKNEDLWPDLARFNLAAFLLTTVGGVGAIITYYFVPEVRAYNRISPLIGFASLVTVAIALEAIRRKWLAQRPAAWYGGLAAITLLAVLDQTSGGFIPLYAADRQAWAADSTYTAALEQRLPPNAEIYQLPHVHFPEGPPIVLLGDWDQTALYLHSNALRYSFGATKGRDSEAWHERLAALPIKSFLEQLILAGFDGVLVYSGGYEDRGVAEEAALTAQLGEAPTFRDDGSLAFYDLSKLRAKYEATVGAAAAGRVRSAVLDMRVSLSDPSVSGAAAQVGRVLGKVATSVPTDISVAFGAGCYGAEGNAIFTYHWCGSNAELILQNDSTHSRAVQLQFTLTTAVAAAFSVKVNGGASVFQSTPQGNAVTETLIAPPGATTLQLSTDAPRVVAPADPRRMVVQIANMHVVEPSSAPASK